MDDLYVVQQLGKKATDEALEVGQIWNEYYDTSLELDSDKE